VSTNLLMPEPPLPDEEVLCRYVRSFKIYCFDTMALDWVEGAWDSTQEDPLSGQTSPAGLPFAVRVEMDLEWPAAKPNQPPILYHTTRTFMLACWQDPTTVTTATTPTAAGAATPAAPAAPAGGGGAGGGGAGGGGAGGGGARGG
jgi:hypothetical protein